MAFCISILAFCMLFLLCPVKSEEYRSLFQRKLIPSKQINPGKVLAVLESKRIVECVLMCKQNSDCEHIAILEDDVCWLVKSDPYSLADNDDGGRIAEIKEMVSSAGKIFPRMLNVFYVY